MFPSVASIRRRGKFNAFNTREDGKVCPPPGHSVMGFKHCAPQSRDASKQSACARDLAGRIGLDRRKATCLFDLMKPFHVHAVMKWLKDCAESPCFPTCRSNRTLHPSTPPWATILTGGWFTTTKSKQQQYICGVRQWFLITRSCYLVESCSRLRAGNRPSQFLISTWHLAMSPGGRPSLPVID